MKTLADVALDEKSAISKPYGSAILASDYRDTGVPVVRGVNLSNGVFQDSEFVFISDDVAAKMPGAHLRPGDLVFTHRGTVGQVSMIPRRPRYEKYVASTSHVKVRLDPQRVVSEFAYYWFSSRPGQQSIAENVSTVGVPGLVQPVATVKALPIPVPELCVQEAIAEVLGALDDKIAANKRVRDLCLGLAEIEAVRSASAPAHPLGSQAEIMMGSSPRGEFLNEDGLGIPFFQGVRDFGALFPSPRVSTTSPVKIAKPGTILLAVRAPVGHVNTAIEEVCIGRGLAAINAPAGNLTLFYLLRASQAIWDVFQDSGTVFSSVNRADVEGVLVPTVPSDKVSEVEDFVTALHNRAVTAEIESKSLAAARDQLLPRLMDGRITVKEAVKRVEDVV